MNRFKVSPMTVSRKTACQTAVRIEFNEFVLETLFGLNVNPAEPDPQQVPAESHFR
jgi:hypothetical protein